MTNKLYKTHKEKIKTIKLNKFRKEYGAACIYYIRLTYKYSLKLYDRPYLRDRIYDRQVVAYNKGFGPKVLVKINKGRYFGYITEHAIEPDDNNSPTDKEMESLYKKINRMKWDTFDVGKNYNIGKIGNRWVLIDFDDCTLGL